MACAQAVDLEALRPWWKMLLRLKHSSCSGISSFKAALCCKETVQKVCSHLSSKGCDISKGAVEK